jgi:tetratricopeptide (TPR) repeat protein
MYMSPEQASGEPVSAASDMYSFGLLLQRLFTSELPYDTTGDFAALLERARNAQTRPVRGGLDPHLTRLLERLKSRAPGARPTAAATAERLLATLKYTMDLARARDVAEARRGQAESLSEFMLFDLREQLEPIGRLDLLADVGTKAMEYFAAIPAGDRTEDELYRHSRALTQIGEVRSAQGNLPGALEAFRESLHLAQELARRAPEDRDRQLGLAASQFWVGYVSYRHEQLDEAKDAFEVYREIAERLVARHPGDAEVRLELGYAHSNLGSVLEARGDLDGALAHFRQCLAIERELAESDPENADLQLDLAKSHNAVGNVLAFQGKLHEALESYLADLAIKQRLHERDPDNMTWRYELAVSHNLAANLYADLGRLDEALPHIEKALSIAEALVAHDPSNEAWGRELALDIKLRARYARQLDESRSEPRDLERAVQILREASARDATDKRLQRELAVTLGDLARALAERGDRNAAERRMQEATQLVEALQQEDPDSSAYAVIAGMVYEIAGVVRNRAQRVDEARAAWTRALDHVETAARESSDPRVLALRGRLLARLGRPEAARPIADRIREMGYRDTETVELFESSGLLPE